jgi:hypothetical protein
MPPELNWESMSDAEKLEYAQHNFAELSKPQIQEWFKLNAQRKQRLEQQKQARVQQQSESHKQVVREKLDEQHSGQKTRVRISDRFVHGPRSCVDCGRPALPHSERCYSCESD